MHAKPYWIEVEIFKRQTSRAFSQPMQKDERDISRFEGIEQLDVAGNFLILLKNMVWVTGFEFKLTHSQNACHCTQTVRYQQNIKLFYASFKPTPAHLLSPLDCSTEKKWSG
ncbi:MAG: hypothetical protein KA436_06555 [Oligoflexales bacterium]|nr:hypothetical protein [Oligoflexales bacterium]